MGNVINYCAPILDMGRLVYMRKSHLKPGKEKNWERTGP